MKTGAKEAALLAATNTLSRSSVRTNCCSIVMCGWYREILQAFPNDPVAMAMLSELSASLQPEMPAK
jgi:hypothetical protein